MYVNINAVTVRIFDVYLSRNKWMYYDYPLFAYFIHSPFLRFLKSIWRPSDVNIATYLYVVMIYVLFREHWRNISM